MTPTPLVWSGETVGGLAGRGAEEISDDLRERRRTRVGPLREENRTLAGRAAGPAAVKNAESNRTGCGLYVCGVPADGS